MTKHPYKPAIEFHTTPADHPMNQTLQCAILVIASYAWNILVLRAIHYSYSLLGIATLIIPLYSICKYVFQQSLAKSKDTALGGTGIALITSTILAVWVPSVTKGSIDPWYFLTNKQQTWLDFAENRVILRVMLVPAIIVALMLVKKLTTLVLFAAFLFHTYYKALNSYDANERIISWSLCVVAVWGTVQSFLNLYRDTTLAVMDEDAPDS